MKNDRESRLKESENKALRKKAAKHVKNDQESRLKESETKALLKKAAKM